MNEPPCIIFNWVVRGDACAFFLKAATIERQTFCLIVAPKKLVSLHITSCDLHNRLVKLYYTSQVERTRENETGKIHTTSAIKINGV